MSQQLFSMDQTWLQCIRCGYRADLLKERKFRCPECGDLFDVQHNFDRVDPNLLRRSFETSSVLSANLHDWQRSGIWRYKGLIMPFMPSEYIVTLGEGNVPIVRAGKHLRRWIDGGIDLWLILEGMTPTGSFKDYGGTVMMTVAKAAGIKALGCASTGDTSAMAAAYAAAAGITCFVILPQGQVTPVQLAQPLVHGAKVITLPGSFDDCMRVVQDLVANHGAYPANSLNPARIEGHQATVFQLAQFFGWNLPDWIAVPVGNGSNSSSIGKGIRTLKDLNLVLGKGSRILGAQSLAANPLADAWERASTDTGGTLAERWEKLYRPIKVGQTVATAARIGDPVSQAKVMREVNLSGGAVLTAAERMLREAVAVCGKDGHFVCPQTGTALATVKRAVVRGLIKPGQRVVVVSTATGLKFTESTAQDLEAQIVKAETCETNEVADILEL